MLALLAPPRHRLSTRRFVGLVAVAVVLVRLTYLGGPLHPDEAGYLIVAREWHLGGPDLYGSYFVDRPPLLIALFRLAAMVHWDPFARLLVVPFAALFVVAAALAAREVAGSRGARWAALVAGALAVTPALGAQEADGEIFAAPLVMLSVAFTLVAVRRPGRGFAWGVAAGLCAGLAVMVKQNFGDGVVFATVLLVVSVAQRRLASAEAGRVAAGGVLGGSVVLLGAAVYAAVSGAGLGGGWFALFGFRGIALHVIADHSLHAPASRAAVLAGLAVVSGAVPLAVVLTRLAWRSRAPGSPLGWAVAATLAVEVLAIAAGGSYWPHYLIQLAPMLALAAGAWASRARALRLVALLTVASAVVATAVAETAGAVAAPSQGAVTGSWLHGAARPGDTATVLYGHAEVLEAAGLTSPYPYLWTLPMRTLDPHLALLRATLGGPVAPAWVVVWSDPNPWGIDAHAKTRLQLATHYRQVRQVCGHQVWLRDGLHRAVPPAPRCG